MKIFLAGATGAAGQALILLLTSHGHTVVGTTRSPSKTGLLRGLGAEAVVVDGLDRDGIRAAVATTRPDAIIHEMTALGGDLDLRKFERSFAATNRLRTEGTDHLLEAARETGVERFIAQSYGAWPYIREGGPVKTEDDPLDPDPPKQVRTTLAAIRHLESAVTGAGGIALRYGGFYGADNDGLVGPVRKRQYPIVGDGGGIASFIHLDDAAAATVLAVERGRPGLYNVVDDDPAPVREWLPVLARVLEAKPPRRFPRWLARLFAGDAAVMMGTESRGASNAKAKRELGWQLRYPSWRQGFAAVYAG